MGCLVLAVIPFALERKLTTLRYFSTVILIIVFFTIWVAIGQSPFFYLAYKDDPRYVVEIFPKLSDFNLRWFQGMASIMLSYNCQITLFYVRGELRHKSSQRVKKVLRNLISIEFLFYLLISVSGYLSLGKNLIAPVFTLRRKMRSILDN